MPIQKLSDVSSKYGAPHGRCNNKGDPDTKQRFYLIKVRVNSGGYDSGGAYWGYCSLGERVYRYLSEEGDIEGFVWAKSRALAKAEMLEDYPDATFFKG